MKAKLDTKMARGLNIRTEPKLGNSYVKRALKPNEIIEITNTEIFADGNLWVQLKDGSWTAKKFLEILTDLSFKPMPPIFDGFAKDIMDGNLYLRDLNTYSGYISNLFTPIEKLHIMAGVRYENNDYLGGTSGPNTELAFNQSAFSPKAGIVYEIVKDKFSVFGNYQNSFKSNGYYASNVAGDMVLSDPERGNQFEGGFKASLFKNRFNATVSYYNIKVKNQLLYTGEYTASWASVQKQAASTLSKGFELAVNAYLVKGFSLVGGLAYNDTIDESTDLRPTTAGSFWNANFNLAYQFVDGKVKGLGFGFGGNYASDNNVTGDFILPKYFVLNANAFYDAKKFRIGVKVDNFTNEHYWTGYSTANPQKLANFLGTVAYKF